ncbi:LysR family transcriptional regulator [Paraburkholderia sartisoli]|uniref:DNA-binding transcriptional regulator, LysR family n=1 Tax=Paraburkholderia sartisoli TaxID=83784 RepID=A0A1H4H7A7_9BURK|nr:LysR family transcriptional regulator [Paraburkholderia sartisoli]SEB17511.1 DNA-binding transcriptional regulator, LysR family [Paraburkholderia sartisoli]
MDKLQAMKTFVRVVEAGSFSAVAHESDTTQSAVSKQVAALERELGARLLTRTTRSLALTEEGERYFEQARRLVGEIAEAEGALRRGEQQLTGWLRIAASVGYGRLKLMPLIQSFLAGNPGVKIDLRLHDGFIDLVEQGIDCAVRLGDLPDSSLIARRLGTAQRMLMAHRSYVRSLPKGLKAPRVPDDLANHNCIVYTELAMRNAWSFKAGPGAADPAGTTRVVRVEGNLQTNSSEVMRASILAGMGIGYSPTWLFDEALASGEVLRMLPEWETVPIPVHLVSPQERRHSAKVRAFAEHVAKAMARE